MFYESCALLFHVEMSFLTKFSSRMHQCIISSCGFILRQRRAEYFARRNFQTLVLVHGNAHRIANLGRALLQCEAPDGNFRFPRITGTEIAWRGRAVFRFDSTCQVDGTAKANRNFFEAIEFSRLDFKHHFVAQMPGQAARVKRSTTAQEPFNTRHNKVVKLEYR